MGGGGRLREGKDSGNAATPPPHWPNVHTEVICRIINNKPIAWDLMGKQSWLETLNRMLSLFKMTKKLWFNTRSKETGYSISWRVVIIFTTMTGHQTSFDTRNNWQKWDLKLAQRTTLTLLEIMIYDKYRINIDVRINLQNIMKKRFTNLRIWRVILTMRVPSTRTVSESVPEKFSDWLSCQSDINWCVNRMN